MEFLKAFLDAIPAAASSAYGFAAYALATAAFMFFIWRVARNKNLLEHIEKLPPKDRLRALEIEMGGARLAKGLSPEQWLRSKVQRYYLLAFLAICAAVVAIVALALWQGARVVTETTIINNNYQQTTNQPLSASDLQRIQEAVAAALVNDVAREQAAVNQLSTQAREVYLHSAMANKEGKSMAPEVIPTGSSTSEAQAAPTAAASSKKIAATTPLTGTNEIEPNNDIFTANEVAINTTITATLENNTDVDYFTFVMPGNTRDIIDVALDNGSAALAPIITFYNSDKSAVNTARNTTGGGDIKHDFVAAPGSRYYLAVSAYSGSGKYRLTIKARNAYDQYEPNDDILSAAPIEIGKTIEANIMDQDDNDYFTFQTSTETKLIVMLENRSTTLAPQLVAFNPDKSARQADRNTTRGGDLNYSFEVKPNSRYYVAVWAYAGYGKYALTVRPQ